MVESWSEAAGPSRSAFLLPAIPELARAAIIILCAASLLSAQERPGAGGGLDIPGLPAIEISAAAPPPGWAIRQRRLLDGLFAAALEFVGKYTREDGTLIWREEWPGMDGSDDGYESFYNFPLYYALGGPDAMLPLSRRLWEGVTRQFTRYGQVHEEFDAYYDWMHHGESYVNFYFFGLSDPEDARTRERAIRFAGLYLGEDPAAPNWDAARKLIRSPINGSRGPRFVNTAEDGVTHRPVLAGYPLPYDDIPGVDSSDAWIDDERFPRILDAINRRMMRGDVPLNLTATSLVANAYLYTGEEKYRRWVLDYVRAWTERARRNGGILPDNVGLSGEIGENMDGKWWGGYYGWRWPHGLFNLLEASTIAASNALLLTGDESFLALPASQIDLVLEKGKIEDGRRLVPHKHGDQGWYQFQPLEPQCPIQLWYLTGREEDWRRVERAVEGQEPLRGRAYRKRKGDAGNEGPWVAFLRGENPDYPERILEATWAESLRRLGEIRRDATRPEERDVHHWQERNPVVLEGLVQLTLGAPNHIYHGGLLHARVRYFDPRRRRPGLPADVAALVERIQPGGIVLTLVNLHPTEARDVIVQAGAFAEHRFTGVSAGGAQVAVDGPCFLVRLAPGAAGRLEARMERYAGRPTYAFPWRRASEPRAGAGSAPASPSPSPPSDPGAPPESFFEKVREQDREAARAFYKKYLDISGIPVASSDVVADEALRRTREVVGRMLAGRPDIIEAMVRRDMYLIIIGKDQVYTDMPEYRNARNPDYLNERVRGTGGNPTSFGEENLLSLPIDRYDDESIAVHEFSHTIDGALRSIDPGWRERRDAVFRGAIDRGLYKDAYAGSNPGEYWAEVCQSYFDCNRVNNWNHGPIGAREQLKDYDPIGYELARSVFNLGPGQDWRYAWLQKLPNVGPPPERFHIDPYYTKFTWAREFIVLGREASDEALLRANDTIRKLFAYRHDILKALIADGVRLVVLGRREGLADLPELKDADPRGIDLLARFLDYAPGIRLLAAGEENVLGDPRDPLVGPCQVIRVFARAMHQVAGMRPVDPDWESRSNRQRQQYELRVQRLDVRFDDRLRGLHEAAMARGAWKGTAAVHDRAAYWTEGVLAYFDAGGQSPAPADAARAIATREALEAYDPGLYALVRETMAYDGRVDWRYRP